MSDQNETAPEKKKARPRRRAKRTAIVPAAPVTLNFESGSGFDLAQRRALALSKSTMVPEAFRGPLGSEGFCNTMLALELAHRLGFPPLLVMQNLCVVEGRPGWLGKFYIALVQAGGVFRDHRWEWRGEKGSDDFGARFIATRVSDGHVCEGRWVDVRLAKAEGWWSKVRNGREWSKWPTMTEQMLVYRSAAFWSSQWNPAATLGIRSVEEEIDSLNAEDPTRTFAAPPPPVPAFAPAGVTLPAEVVRSPAELERVRRAGEAATDRTLDPGFDPPSMERQPDPFDPDEAIREAIRAGDFPRALVAITGMTPSPRKTALQREYSAAKNAVRK